MRGASAAPAESPRTNSQPPQPPPTESTAKGSPNARLGPSPLSPSDTLPNNQRQDKGSAASGSKEGSSSGTLKKERVDWSSGDNLVRIGAARDEYFSQTGRFFKEENMSLARFSQIVGIPYETFRKYVCKDVGKRRVLGKSAVRLSICTADNAQFVTDVLRRSDRANEGMSLLRRRGEGGGGVFIGGLGLKLGLVLNGVYFYPLAEDGCKPRTTYETDLHFPKVFLSGLWAPRVTRTKAYWQLGVLMGGPQLLPHPSNQQEASPSLYSSAVSQRS